MRCEFCCRMSTTAYKMGITFHNFPTDELMKNAWIEACVSRGCELDKNMIIKTKRLCSNHFNTNDFEGDPLLLRRRLKKNVVPTRFSSKPFLYCIACSDVASEYSDVHLHEFPEDAGLKKKWADACRQNGCHLKQIFSQYALCSNHFPKNYFIHNRQGKQYLKPNAVPQIFFLSDSASKSAQQKSISKANFVDSTNVNFVGSTSNVLANFAPTSAEVLENSTIASDLVKCRLVVDKNVPSSFMKVSGGKSKNSVSATDLSDNISPVITSGAKRSFPLMDKSAPNSPPKSDVKIKSWRTARAGDLRKEHFDTPRKTRKKNYILTSKYKRYATKIVQYRNKIERLQRIVKTLENLLLFHLTDKKLTSQETASEIGFY